MEEHRLKLRQFLVAQLKPEEERSGSRPVSHKTGASGFRQLIKDMKGVPYDRELFPSKMHAAAHRWNQMTKIE